MVTDNNRYYVNDQEVTREHYMASENAAGFHPKIPGNPATGSFSNGNIRGRIEYGR